MDVRPLLLACLLGLQAAPPKAAPPADVEATKKVIRDSFRADYASRAPDVLKRLAERLRDEALRVKDPSEMFAFLEEARDVAVKAGELELTLGVIDTMGKRYDLDVARMKSKALDELKAKVKGPEATKALAQAYADALEEAAEAKDFDTALGLVPKVETAARAVKDEALLARMRDRAKELRDLQTEQREIAAARKKLAESPDDPVTNVTVGLYRCFVEEDWIGGVALLAKGGDAAAAKLARLELAEPAEPAAQETLADGWWEAARQQKARTQDGFRERAFHWYEAAGKKLTGLAKLQLEKKIERLNEENAGRTRPHKVLGYRLKSHPRGASRLGGHWYQTFPETPSTREEARKRCQEMGGYLACVETEEEQAFVEKLAGQNKVWIGGSSAEDGKWSWMNGQPMTYKRWASGQPNNGANCFAEYWPGQGWHDIGANEQDRYAAGFICEWEF